MEQNKMTKYGVLVAAGVASVLIGGQSKVMHVEL